MLGCGRKVGTNLVFKTGYRYMDRGTNGQPTIVRWMINLKIMNISIKKQAIG